MKFNIFWIYFKLQQSPPPPLTDGRWVPSHSTDATVWQTARRSGTYNQALLQKDKALDTAVRRTVRRVYSDRTLLGKKKNRQHDAKQVHTAPKHPTPPKIIKTQAHSIVWKNLGAPPPFGGIFQKTRGGLFSNLFLAFLKFPIEKKKVFLRKIEKTFSASRKTRGVFLRGGGGVNLTITPDWSWN